MNGMLKAGLIGLLVGGFFGLGVTLLIPYCTPCAAILVGLGVGFLACLWDKPLDGGSGAVLGAKSGVIAGIGHMLGQMLGMVLNGILVGPEGAAETAAQLGLDLPMMDTGGYWLSQILINGLCGVTNIAIAAGLGALGGFLWYQTIGSKRGSQ
jgi:hypothetical protein